MVKNWALVIGINDYHYLQPLKYAKQDARRMQEFLENEAGFEQVFFFNDETDTNGNPTHPDRANLLQFLEQLSEQPFMEAEDNFWFFFIGHGIVHDNCDYLMPSNGNPNDIKNTAISVNYIIDCLRDCGSDNIILVLDACRNQEQHSKQKIGRQTSIAARQNQIVLFLSCSASEYSYEIEALQQGAFAYALLEALSIRGQCATVERLNQYLRFRVCELARQYNKAQQTPDIIIEPATKSHQILLPQHATLHDIAALKKDAIDTIEEDFELASKRGLDYTRLQDLLAAQKWKQADQETATVILKVAGRERERWLNVESINNFPNADLHIIDQLWDKYSNGRFGLSVQKQVWETVGGHPNADFETWCKFGDYVAWRLHNNWLFYNDLTFNINAPRGCFPATGILNILTPWSGWAVGTFASNIGFSALASKLESQKLKTNSNFDFISDKLVDKILT